MGAGVQSRPLRVAAGVLRRNGRYLVCRRALDGPHPGRWEFPGGKCRAGESPVAALARELREELAIAAVVGPEIWRTRHAYPGGPCVEVVFHLVERFTGTPVNRVFAEIRWAGPRELRGLDFLEADRPLLERLTSGGRLPAAGRTGESAR